MKCKKFSKVNIIFFLFRENESKGTRLNDAQYFRLPLPHARKKMTMMQVMPRIADSISDCLQHAAKSRDNRRTVESRQSSVEIALVACRGFEDIEQSKKLIITAESLSFCFH